MSKGLVALEAGLADETLARILNIARENDLELPELDPTSFVLGWLHGWMQFHEHYPEHTILAIKEALKT